MRRIREGGLIIVPDTARQAQGQRSGNPIKRRSPGSVTISRGLSFVGLHPSQGKGNFSIYFSIINIKLDRLFACHRVIGVDMGYIPYKPARPVLELFL